MTASLSIRQVSDAWAKNALNRSRGACPNVIKSKSQVVVGDQFSNL